MKRTILKQTMSIWGMFTLAMLFFACSDPLQIQKPQEQNNKVMVTITVENTPGRTVFPLVSLEDVAYYTLLGAKSYSGEEETELATFIDETTFILLDAADWRFTLNAYNSADKLILQGKVDKYISYGSTVSFNLSGLEDGVGAIRITLNFPEVTGIMRMSVSGGVDSEDFPITTNGEFVYTKTGVDAGNYLIHFSLYREDVLRATISEQVLVRSNLTSSATITLEGDDLKRTLSGTASISPSAGVSIGTELTASYNGIETVTTWQWNKDGAAIEDATEAAYTPNETGDYTVTVGAETYNNKTSAAVGVVGAAQTVPDDTLNAQLLWLASNAASYGNYILTVSDDEAIAPFSLSYPGKNNIVITLKGADVPQTISLASNGALFTVGDTVTLVLDENITLKGHANSGSLVRIESGGALVMNAGSVITGNGNSPYSDYSTSGGGVYVADGGTFTMNDGEISGNSASVFLSYNNIYYSTSGGGVYVAGTFTMSGGTISNNGVSSETSGAASISYSYGGGVYVAENASFTMSGGTISENTAYSRSAISAAASYGGGVYVTDGGTFTMSGGTISENKTQTYNYPGTFNYSQGGGVYVYSDGIFTMSGGTISSNTATEGGGVYGGLTMHDGQITGNTARDGGGVYASGTFTMHDGTISDNTASYNGGGVYANRTFTMYDGTISDNTARNGGGVYSEIYFLGDAFTIHNGTISGNTAASSGGGVYVYSGNFTKISGIIYGYTEGDSNSNVVKDDSDDVLDNQGHAVYIRGDPAKRRETTAGPGDNLDSNISGADGGWVTE